jgi:hypothetical protein
MKSDKLERFYPEMYKTDIVNLRYALGTLSLASVGQADESLTPGDELSLVGKESAAGKEGHYCA